MLPVELRKKVDELGPWYFNHQLPFGVTTGEGVPDPTHSKIRLLLEHGAFTRQTYGYVLDLGANSGLNSMWFVDNKDSTVVAVEAGPKYYEQLLFAIEVKGYGDKIAPFKDDVRDAQFGTTLQYDLVLYLGVMHHIGDQYHEAVLSRCHDVLYPGGELVVQTRSDLPVERLLTEIGFQDIIKLCDWPAHHNKSAWQAIKDPMKL